MNIRADISDLLKQLPEFKSRAAHLVLEGADRLSISQFAIREGFWFRSREDVAYSAAVSLSGRQRRKVADAFIKYFGDVPSGDVFWLGSEFARVRAQAYRSIPQKYRGNIRQFLERKWKGRLESVLLYLAGESADSICRITNVRARGEGWEDRRHVVNRLKKLRERIESVLAWCEDPNEREALKYLYDRLRVSRK